MFNVHINDGTNELPKDDVFYIVAKEGIFLRKKLGIMDSIAPVDKISTLESITTSAKMHIKKIPGPTVAKITDFFKKVYEEHRSEAVVLLFYQEDTQKYRIVPPHQKVSGASVDYNRGITLEGWTMIGTIHSHAAMSAFHSGTDQGDEESFDGLHITLGNMGSEDISISASIVANGHRVMVDPEEYMDGIKKVADIDEELPYYTRQVFTYKKGKLQLDEDASKKFIATRRRFDKRYRCTAPPSKSSCNPNWMKVVEKGHTVYNYSWRNRQHGQHGNLHGWRSGYGYGYGHGYGVNPHANYHGYNSHFDPNAWRERAGITHLGPDEGGKVVVNSPTELHEKNQAIIDSLDFENGDTVPCLTCKHRECKILMEEDDTVDEYLFYCTKCKKMYTETDLETADETEGYECPVCKTDDYFEIVDEKEFESNYEALTKEQLMTQPDQEGFITCVKCKNSFLKLSTDTECPVCQASIIDEPEVVVSTEEMIIDQHKKDSGIYIGTTEEEQEEILKQAAEADKNLERIPDPEQKAVPLSAKPESGGLLNMFKRVFNGEKL